MQNTNSFAFVVPKILSVIRYSRVILDCFYNGFEFRNSSTISNVSGFHQQLDTMRVTCAFIIVALLYQRTYASRFPDLSRILFSAPYTRAYNIQSQSLSYALDAE